MFNMVQNDYAPGYNSQKNQIGRDRYNAILARAKKLENETDPRKWSMILPDVERQAKIDKYKPITKALGWGTAILMTVLSGYLAYTLMNKEPSYRPMEFIDNTEAVDTIRENPGNLEIMLK